MQILISSAKFLASLRSVSAQLSSFVLQIKYILLNVAKLKQKLRGEGWEFIFFYHCCGFAALILLPLLLCTVNEPLGAFLFGGNFRHWVLLEKETIHSQIAVFRCEQRSVIKMGKWKKGVKHPRRQSWIYSSWEHGEAMLYINKYTSWFCVTGWFLLMNYKKDCYKIRYMHYFAKFHSYTEMYLSRYLMIPKIWE